MQLRSCRLRRRRRRRWRRTRRRRRRRTRSRSRPSSCRLPCARKTHNLSTVWGGRLRKSFCSMFSGSSTCLAWQLQFSPTACGTVRKNVTKPFPRPTDTLCIAVGNFNFCATCWTLKLYSFLNLHFQYLSHRDILLH